VGFILVSMTNKLKENRENVVKRSLYKPDDHRSLSMKIEELARLTDLRSPKADWEDKESVVSKKANRTLYSTMSLIKGDLSHYFVKRPDRARNAVEYLAAAQLDEGGIERMIMADKFAKGKTCQECRGKRPSEDDKAAINQMPEGPAKEDAKKATKQLCKHCNGIGYDVKLVYDKNGKPNKNHVLKAAEGTFGLRTYTMFVESGSWRAFSQCMIYIFMACEYDDSDSVSSFAIQFILITVLLADSIIVLYFTCVEREAMDAQPTKLKIYHCMVCTLNTLFLILKVFSTSDPLRFTRPLLLFFRTKKVVKAASLFLNSIFSAAHVFLVFFMTITLACILALILLRGEMSGDPTLNNFLESFNQMFVLIATGENYADLIPAAIGLSDWYFFFFAVFTLAGLFFLGSLLIATFESQYKLEQVEFTIMEKENLLHRIAPTFCLWTYQMPGADKQALEKNKDRPEILADKLRIQKDSFKELMIQFWNHSSQTPVVTKLCEARLRKRILLAKVNAVKKDRTFKDHDRVTLERKVNHELVHLAAIAQMPVGTPSERCAKEDAKKAAEQEMHKMRDVMVDYAGRVFELLDADDSETLDFEEFAEITTYLKLMPELQTNNVFKKQMQIEAVKNAVRMKEKNLDTPDKTGEKKKKMDEMFSIKRLNEQSKRLELDLQKAIAVADDLFWGGASEKHVDTIVSILTTIQCGFLANYGSKMSHTVIDIAGVVFVCFHILDIVVRVIQMKGIKPWLVAQGKSSVKLKRWWSLICVSISAAGLLCYGSTKVFDDFDESVGTKLVKAFQMAMAVSIFRLMVTIQSFAQLLFSISSGLEPVSIYFVLLIIIMSLYSSMAFVLFRNMENPIGEVYWASPYDSFTTMFQLLVGEGWNGVMDYTTQHTYKVVQFFFMSYTMITTILFSQLFLGIIIQLYSEMEDLRREGGDLYVTLGRLCPDKKADKSSLDKLIWGLMSSGADQEEYDCQDYEKQLPQIELIQKRWRSRRNLKLYEQIQNEVHPLCALVDGKFPHTAPNQKPTFEKFLSNIRMIHAFVHVPSEVVRTDSWFEQHFLIRILNQRYEMFTQWTHVRLKNPLQVFELLSFLGTHLRLYTDFVEVLEPCYQDCDEDHECIDKRSVTLMPLGEELLQHIIKDEAYEPGNELSIFNDIVFHGDLTVIVQRIKAAGMDLSQPGNRILDSGETSTVEEDLMEAAEESDDWDKEGVDKVFSTKKQTKAMDHLYGSREIDANMGQVKDGENTATWQSLIKYTVQAARENKLYGDYAQDPEETTLENAKTAESGYFDHHEEVATAVVNPDVVKELDCLARIVRLRALLSVHCERKVDKEAVKAAKQALAEAKKALADAKQAQQVSPAVPGEPAEETVQTCKVKVAQAERVFKEATDGIKLFTEPWDFTAFAHWFLDAFYLPITKVWL